MNFFAQSIENSLKELKTDKEKGLTRNQVEKSRTENGKNILTKKTKKTLINKIFSALKEPMLIILLFSFVLAFGVSLGKFFKSGQADFGECLGILVAVSLSVLITLIMEGSSERAFALLNKIYDNVAVKVIRNGVINTISQQEIVVGDIILLESGEKIVADGRIIECNSLTVDESALTGESIAVEKNYSEIYGNNTPLAERKNMLYSGTFITSGTCKMVATAVGDKTEIGNIATEISGEKQGDTPLQHKLTKLGKTITIIGALCAVLVFVLSIVKLVLTNSITFEGVQELFVSCVILIVAAVPEGLPTIVAVSLALNMIKLAKENALIKKMTATETAGAVSVICSDKTGTLTQNKMSVISICSNEFCLTPDKLKKEHLHQNFVCNSTAGMKKVNNKISFNGNRSECALLEAYVKSNPKISYNEFRNKYSVIDRQPFDSDSKIMSTTIKIEGFNRKLVKGAPEAVLKNCELTDGQKTKIIFEMQAHQKKARRILCFAHLDYSNENDKNKKMIYDGYVTISDPIRKDVKQAVNECNEAGIKIKMLTGDNMTTAFAIAKELNITNDEKSVINGYEIEKVSNEQLKNILPKISVIARSTPSIKLRVVRVLKEMGEVVAVTGDGINDAPAIKHSDVGFAMGGTGTDITKEVADVVLLDDSFNSVVKAISFGRNVYRNLQRFILFQLSVNLSALLFITVCSIIGLPSPFNTLQLLWINVIMDGPPALTLGLESMNKNCMKQKPVKKSEGIVSCKMFIRIIFNGIYVSVIMLLQYIYNFLGVSLSEKSATIFTLFIFFQLFNAFNSRELGAQSILKSFGKNKIMVFTFTCVFIVHLFIVQLLGNLFGVSAMSGLVWLKCLIVSSSIVVVSEVYKFFYRLLRFDRKSYKTVNLNKILYKNTKA